MRTAAKNKQKMYYSLYTGDAPVYETDAYGNIVYIEVDGERIPVETGELKKGYSTPTEFYGNITMSGGESEAVEFGVNLAEYEAVLLLAKDSLPIDETSLIWLDTVPVIYADGTPDSLSADYTVIKVSPSLNFVRYVLKKVVK